MSHLHSRHPAALTDLAESAAALRALARATTSSEAATAAATIAWLTNGKNGPQPGTVDLRCLRPLDSSDRSLCQQERLRKPVPDHHHGVDAYEPACGAHPSSDERSHRTIAWAAHEANDPGAGSRPACWSWNIPSGTGDTPIERLQSFHAGRCAICGRPARRRHVDHDHVTLDVRGYLCQPCNVAEGRKSEPVQIAYRLRHPADILGVRVAYRTLSMAASPHVYDPARVETTAGYERHLLTYLDGRQDRGGLERALRARVGALAPPFQALLPPDVRAFCGLP